MFSHFFRYKYGIFVLLLNNNRITLLDSEQRKEQKSYKISNLAKTDLEVFIPTHSEYVTTHKVFSEKLLAQSLLRQQSC